MGRKRQEGMTDRETELMHVIWSHDEATVEEVRARVKDDLADSTVRTMLSIMERKGYLSSRLQGRLRVYRALIERKEAQSSALRAMTRRLFQGSPDLLIARLIEDEDISIEELDRMRAALRRRNKEAGR